MSAKLPNVLTDAEKVKEVLTNLVENALKFTPKGSVIIGALENEQQEVRLSVTDTGVGISAADQKKIFQKFYRTENWKTRKTGGTGLGLYISKSLVEQIGAQIGVDGNLDHGSTFWFSLPLTVDVKKRKSGREKKLDEFIKSI